MGEASQGKLQETLLVALGFLVILAVFSVAVGAIGYYLSESPTLLSLCIVVATAAVPVSASRAWLHNRRIRRLGPMLTDISQREGRDLLLIATDTGCILAGPRHAYALDTTRALQLETIAWDRVQALTIAPDTYGNHSQFCFALGADLRSRTYRATDVGDFGTLFLLMRRLKKDIRFEALR
jgi:hypothetical protein